MSTNPETRAAELQALLIERYGPLADTARERAATPAELLRRTQRTRRLVVAQPTRAAA